VPRLVHDDTAALQAVLFCSVPPVWMFRSLMTAKRLGSLAALRIRRSSGFGPEFGVGLSSVSANEVGRTFYLHRLQSRALTNANVILILCSASCMLPNNSGSPTSGLVFNPDPATQSRQVAGERKWAYVHAAIVAASAVWSEGSHPLSPDLRLRPAAPPFFLLSA
jgi:hypothetical protein